LYGFSLTSVVLMSLQLRLLGWHCLSAILKHALREHHQEGQGCRIGLTKAASGSSSGSTTSFPFLSSPAAFPGDQNLQQQQQGLVFGQPLSVIAPLLGVLCSSSISAAEAEVAAGAEGSKEVRAAAVHVLQQLLQLMGPSPQLAFFMPGVVTGLGKLLRATGGA
jgi:hypothetical protein